MALTDQDRAEIGALIRQAIADASSQPAAEATARNKPLDPEEIRSDVGATESENDPFEPVWELLRFLDAVIKASKKKDEITFSKSKLVSKMPKRTMRRQMGNITSLSKSLDRMSEREREGDYDYRRCNNDWDPMNDDDPYDPGFADCKAD